MPHLAEKALPGFRVEDPDSSSVVGNEKPAFRHKDKTPRKRPLLGIGKRDDKDPRGAADVKEDVSVSHRVRDAFVGVLLFKGNLPGYQIHDHKHLLPH